MAKTLVSVEDYLHTSYETEMEYVDGVLEERNVGEWWHAAWQACIGSFFFSQSDSWNIRVRLAQRTRIGERRYRVPDVAVFDEHTPPDPVAITPPLIAFEVLSPEDRIYRMIVRLADFESMSVPAIYVVQPEDGGLMRFQDGGLKAADEVVLRDRRITWREVAATLR